MKLLLSLILILTIVSNFCFADISNQYVNFEVFSDPQCLVSNSSYGVGFTFAANTCVTDDYTSNHLFTVKGNTVTGQDFQSQGAELCTTPLNPPYTYKVNSCVEPGNFVTDIDKWIEAPYKPFYYKVTVSSVPIIQTNSMALVYMDQECNLDYVIYAKYYMNGTIVKFHNQDYMYFCDGDTPMSGYCPGTSGTCNSPTYSNYVATCESYAPFYNTSTELTGCQGSTCSGGFSGFSSSGAISASSDNTGTGSASGGQSRDPIVTFNGESRGSSPAGSGSSIFSGSYSTICF
ncbi:hypothetical protein DICPUDRAFT_25187 [Dictyostelium purpureum]|uniref:Carbohydrate binding domain-containing protein n=1 Tax=Dictyostelium purpureum TaxID=5786 RepID=F0Z6T6_DICPU|nr:uncharacterized protein DICPUDRAFT_25187 [Dictyostelium purpureum]EGC40366.1 hypothetical protein DICPUDRAFT_25187 [Dictyostelium purpureum]|eukprot:XP_003283117.1 hypothetical protein DICPUDRAFT_25187 [Dictyostelium purpureum]